MHMYCRFADLNATLKVLEAGDIVLKVQGSEIGDDGKVPFRGTGLMSFRFFSHVGTSGHLWIHMNSRHFFGSMYCHIQNTGGSAKGHWKPHCLKLSGTRNERIDFHYLISQLFVGDTCDFTILRKQRKSLLWNWELHWDLMGFPWGSMPCTCRSQHAPLVKSILFWEATH